MKVVLYARSSPGSPPTIAQLERLRKWAAGMEYVVAGEFSDDQVTGKNFDPSSRLAFYEAIKALDNADAIAAVKLDRVGRSLFDMVKLLNEIKAKNKILITSEDGINTGSEYGEFFFKLMALIAEYELNRNKERQSAGIARAKEQDRINGAPSRFGRKKKISDPAPVLALRREGFSFAQIARKLGVSTATISSMIRSEGDPIKTSQVALKEAQETVRR